MTSSNGNIFIVTGPLRGEFIGIRWIPRTQRPVVRSFDVSLICAWIYSWVNNREVGDLRGHRAHYDVIVMSPHTPYPHPPPLTPTPPHPPPDHPTLHSQENNLEHWGRDKLDAFLQTTFSNQFSSMNNVGFWFFWFNFYWNWTPRVPLTINNCFK